MFKKMSRYNLNNRLWNNSLYNVKNRTWCENPIKTIFDELIHGLRMKQLESITPTEERGKTPMKGEILMLHYNKEKPKNY